MVDGTGLEQQRRRPLPAAETGRSCWGSILIFQSPAKGLRKNQQMQPVRPRRFPTRRNVYRDAGTVWGCFCGGRYRTRTKMNKGRVSPWRWYPAFLCSQPELCFSPTFHDCPQRSLLDRPQKPYSNREGHCFGCGNSQPYASQTKFHRQNDQKQKQQCKRAKKCDQS